MIFLLFVGFAMLAILAVYGVLWLLRKLTGHPLLDDSYQRYEGPRCPKCGGDHWAGRE